MTKLSLKPYEKLCRIYDPKEFTAENPILAYLISLGSKCQLSLDSVLDIACGTGSLLKRLLDAAISNRLVGLDISENMLAVARTKFRHDDNIKLIHGDFRHFSLGETFDTVVCNFDSLNYVEYADEVALVFDNVYKHLNAPGFFVFDVITEKHCLWSNGYSHDWGREGTTCKASSHYDAKLRKMTSTLEFENGIETHRQIPLEYDAIIEVAKEKQFSVEGAYANRSFAPVAEDTKRIYFVLKK